MIRPQLIPSKEILYKCGSGEYCVSIKNDLSEGKCVIKARTFGIQRDVKLSYLHTNWKSSWFALPAPVLHHLLNDKGKNSLDKGSTNL